MHWLDSTPHSDRWWGRGEDLRFNHRIGANHRIVGVNGGHYQESNRDKRYDGVYVLSIFHNDQPLE